MRADRQTNRQTHGHADHNNSYPYLGRSRHETSCEYLGARLWSSIRSVSKCSSVLYCRVVQRLSASDAAAGFQRRMSAASNSERTELDQHSTPARRHRQVADQHHPSIRASEEREFHVHCRTVNDAVLRTVNIRPCQHKRIFAMIYLVCQK